jgi:NhaP-type Na+/H+ and K+/H+ antiporter
METTIIFTVLNISILIIGTWLSFRRTKFQNVLDDSTASVNYRKLVVELQAEVKELTNKLDASHLEVSMSIEYGKKPDIIDWKWIKKDLIPESVEG